MKRLLIALTIIVCSVFAVNSHSLPITMIPIVDKGADPIKRELPNTPSVLIEDGYLIEDAPKITSSNWRIFVDCDSLKGLEHYCLHSISN